MLYTREQEKNVEQYSNTENPSQMQEYSVPGENATNYGVTIANPQQASLFPEASQPPQNLFQNYTPNQTNYFLLNPVSPFAALPSGTTNANTTQQNMISNQENTERATSSTAIDASLRVGQDQVLESHSSNQPGPCCSNPQCLQAASLHKQEIENLKAFYNRIIIQNRISFLPGSSLERIPIAPATIRSFPFLNPSPFSRLVSRPNSHLIGRPNQTITSQPSRPAAETSITEPLIRSVFKDQTPKGWPTMARIRTFLESINLKQYCQRTGLQGAAKKVILNDVNQMLLRVIDADCLLFQEWVQLYKSTLLHKMATLGNGIIEHLLQWVTMFRNFGDIPTAILLDNLKRCLLRIFHRVKGKALYRSLVDTGSV